MSHEIYVKFSVDDTERFYDWLHDGINEHAAGYDAFYTLVKDGVASRDFDRHLDIEAREAVAIAEALRIVNGEDNDDILAKSSIALSILTDCDDIVNIPLTRANLNDFDGLPYRNEVVTETVSTVSIDRISSALNALYAE